LHLVKKLPDGPSIFDLISKEIQDLVDIAVLVQSREVFLLYFKFIQRLSNLAVAEFHGLIEPFLCTGVISLPSLLKLLVLSVKISLLDLHKEPIEVSNLIDAHLALPQLILHLVRVEGHGSQPVPKITRNVD
jgi:hypothetical protein